MECSCDLGKLKTEQSMLKYKILMVVMRPHAIRNNNFDNFHTHLRYGLIFVNGNMESKGTFKLEKEVMSVISSVQKQTTCRQIFINLNIHPVACMYITGTL